jgi:hypothetical protein
MANSGMTAVGVGAIGFGALFVYSAFTKKPLFGPNGMVRTFIATGSVEGTGAAVGKAFKTMTDLAASIQPTAEETRRPLNDKPPGA